MESIDYGAHGRDHFNWAHQAGTGGYIVAKQTTEDIRNGGNGNSFHSIDWPGHLRRAPRKVYLHLRALNGDPHPDRNLAIRYTVVIEHVLGLVFSVRNCA